MTETFNTRHTVTGKLARLTADQIEPFKDYLEIVPDDAKPFEPGLFKPGKVGEFDNPEPLTDAELNANAELEDVLEDSAPNSKAARAAKKAADEAAAQAEADRAAAEKAAEDLGETDSPSTSEGEN